MHIRLIRYFTGFFTYSKFLIFSCVPSGNSLIETNLHEFLKNAQLQKNNKNFDINQLKCIFIAAINPVRKNINFIFKVFRFLITNLITDTMMQRVMNILKSTHNLLKLHLALHFQLFVPDAKIFRLY